MYITACYLSQSGTECIEKIIDILKKTEPTWDGTLVLFITLMSRSSAWYLLNHVQDLFMKMTDIFNNKLAELGMEPYSKHNIVQFHTTLPTNLFHYNKLSATLEA